MLAKPENKRYDSLWEKITSQTTISNTRRNSSLYQSILQIVQTVLSLAVTRWANPTALANLLVIKRYIFVTFL